MADQPQPSNNSRITAMLKDLADARAKSADPQQPVRPPVSSAIPPNLPVAQRPMPAAPAPRPMPQAPVAQRPPASIAQPPRPTAPAPIPREMPVPSVPPPPRPPTPVAPMPLQKPVVPPAPKPIAPVAPAVPGQPYTSELRTMSGDIGRISTGQAPAGVPLSRPTPPPAPSPSVPPAVAPAPVAPAAPAPVRATIVIPDGSGHGGIGKVFLIGSVLLVLMVAVYVFVFRDSGTPDTTPTPSASPSVSATLSPAAKTLRSYFGTPGATINITESTSAQGEFKTALSTSQPAQKQAVVLSVQKDSTTMVSADFLSAILPGTPAELTSSLASDWIALAYGQTEAFDDAGTSIQTTTPSPRAVLVFELTDASKANQALASWQAGELAQSGQNVFGYDISRAIVATFSTGTYRQITVNYRNFPYADKSIDYAIVLASNGKNYLVISGSRQSMFFAIDQLMQ